jgi:hypothetical protein
MIYDDYRMTRRAISVTLDGDNLTWLKGRAGAGGVRSVSELLNHLVTAARRTGRGGPSRSVMGTIDIDSADPGLEHADAAVRALFDASTARPFILRETRPARRSLRGRSKKRTSRG